MMLNGKAKKRGNFFSLLFSCFGLLYLNPAVIMSEVEKRVVTMKDDEQVHIRPDPWSVTNALHASVTSIYVQEVSMNIIVLIYVLFIKDLCFFVGFHLITGIMIYFLQGCVIFGTKPFIYCTWRLIMFGILLGVHSFFRWTPPLLVTLVRMCVC